MISGTAVNTVGRQWREESSAAFSESIRDSQLVLHQYSKGATRSVFVLFRSSSSEVHALLLTERVFVLFWEGFGCDETELLVATRARSASLGAPHGPSEQEVIALAVRAAGTPAAIQPSTHVPSLPSTWKLKFLE